MKKLKVKLIRSATGRPETQKKTVKGLGLTKLNCVREHPDTPATRGMIRKISHLVVVLDS